MRGGGNTTSSPVCMAAYFEGLGIDILTNKERQLDTSVVAQPLLMALNHQNTLEQNLKEKKQLLCNWIKQFEHGIANPLKLAQYNKSRPCLLRTKGTPNNQTPMALTTLRMKLPKIWSRGSSRSESTINSSNTYAKEIKVKKDLWDAEDWLPPKPSCSLPLGLIHRVNGLSPSLSTKSWNKVSQPDY